jgi:hypothetical protein
MAKPKRAVFPKVSVATAESFAEALSVDTGLDHSLFQINCLGKGQDVILGSAFASAFAEADALALATADPRLFSVAIADSTAVVSSFAVATGIDNSDYGYLNTGKGRDFIQGQGLGISVARSSAGAGATAVGFFYGIALAAAEASAYAGAMVKGIDNSQGGILRTGRGADTIVGRAVAFADATATASSEAAAAGCKTALATATAGIENITSVTALTEVVAIGIDNYHGTILTNKGPDTVYGEAYIDTSALAVAGGAAFALAEAVAVANAQATAVSASLAYAAGIQNAHGHIITGQGRDQVIGIATIDQNILASADAEAIALGSNSSSTTNTVSLADGSQVEAIGIDNVGGEIRTGRGDDFVLALGMTAGLRGGVVITGQGNDHLIAGRINDYDPLTQQPLFASDQTGALQDVTINLGHGDDILEAGHFSGQVIAKGGRGQDTLILLGDGWEDMDISLGRNHTFTLSKGHDLMTVQGFEQFHVSGQVYDFHGFANYIG